VDTLEVSKTPDSNPAPELTILDVWRQIFEAQVRLISEKRFTAGYNAYRRKDRSAFFELNGIQEDLSWEKIQNAQYEPLKILDINSQSGQADAGVENNYEPEAQSNTVGILREIYPEQNEIEVLLDEEIEKLLRRRLYKIPQPGLIIYNAGGSPFPIQYLERSLETLQRGRSPNPRLAEFLFEPAAANLPDEEKRIQISQLDLRFPYLKSDQIRAVEGALNAPDLFMLQIGDGAAKTAIIAEICFQAASRGGRILIAGLSNQAIDSVMSFLAQYEDMRVLRMRWSRDPDSGKHPDLEAVGVVPEQGEDPERSALSIEDAQAKLAALEHALILQDSITQKAEQLIETTNEALILKNDLDEASSKLKRADNELEKTLRELDQYNGLQVYLEYILEQMTQPKFGVSTGNLRDYENEANIELIRSHPVLLGLQQITETLSDQLTDWSDITVMRLEKVAVYSVYRVFRQADQVLKAHSRVSEQAKILHEWVRKLEPDIRRYYASRRRADQVEAQKMQIDQVIRECETVTEQSRNEFPRVREEIQKYAQLHTNLYNTQQILQDWLEEVVKQSLDPEFVPLPNPINTPECDEVWSKVWNGFKPNDFRALYDSRQQGLDMIQHCDRLHTELNELAEQLMQFTSPQALEEIGQPKISWETDWISDLVGFDGEGMVFPKEDAQDKLREMGEAFLASLQDPEWRVEKFKNDSRKLHRQIARRIGQLREIARVVNLRKYQLEEQDVQLSTRIETELHASAVELHETALRITRQMGNLKYQEYTSLQNQANRAIERLGEMKTRLAALEKQEITGGQAIERIRKVLEANEQDSESIFPAVNVVKTLKELENLDEKEWDNRWHGELEAFEKKLKYLDTMADQLQPVTSLKVIIKDVKRAIERLESIQNGLEAELRALGNEINRNSVQFADNKTRLEACRAEWLQVFSEVAEEIRPYNPDGDAFSPVYLQKVIDESKSWFYERNRMAGLLKPEPKTIPEWMSRLQQVSEQDEHSLRQVYMAQANVVGATCGLIGSPQFTRQCQDFDYVVIDEANLATPPELLLAMLKGKKIVLVGDNRNLSPMIGAHFVSQLAEDLGLSDDDVEQVGRSYFIDMFKKCPDELRLSLIEDA
jgi:hypothetical protein